MFLFSIVMKFLISTLFVVFLIILSIHNCCQAGSARTKIAVLDFELYGTGFSTEELGTMVAEWFITSLVTDGRFEVVERARLQQLIAEQKLGTSGIIDDTSASKLGKILGAKIVVTGSVLKYEENLEINARVISVEDGGIIAAENISCRASNDLRSVVKELTTAIVKNFPLNGYIVKKNDQSVLIDIGENSGVHKGMFFDVFCDGKVIKHPVSGEVIDTERILTGRVQVVQFLGNLTEAKIVNEKPAGIEYGQLVQSVQTIKSNGNAQALKAETTLRKSAEMPAVKSPQNSYAVSAPPKKRTELTPRKETRTVMAPDCSGLLKAWQLGDSSVMQRYLKECTQ